MDIASGIVKKMVAQKPVEEENPKSVCAKAILSAIRTGNEEGLSKALENHYYMTQQKILDASSQESAGDEANKVSTE